MGTVVGTVVGTIVGTVVGTEWEAKMMVKPKWAL